MAQKPLTEGITKSSVKMIISNNGQKKPFTPTLSKPSAPPAPKPKRKS
ncbi:MAG: hypothetical protein Q9N02_05015 [Ghiorsea sp.]|nr:hypothetical protein [Ghiorsea sp.]